MKFRLNLIIIVIMLSVEVLKAFRRNASPKHFPLPEKRFQEHQEQYHLSFLFLPVIRMVGY